MTFCPYSPFFSTPSFNLILPSVLHLEYVLEKINPEQRVYWDYLRNQIMEQAGSL